MKKTLLLVFIHGFRGDESTFGKNYKFTEDLRELVAERLPKINVKVFVYPKYETRGDLQECVNRFRDWLLEKVIDLEVAAGTASPTIDPSVRTVLIGHSMGGIVAAETLIALSSDKPVEFSSSQDDDATSTDGGRESGGSSSSANAKSHQTNSNSQKRDLPTTGAPIADAATGGFHYNGLMFPYIQGVLAFDTPFLGISPGVVAHGAEGRYAAASELASQLSGLAALWGGAKAATSTSSSGPSKAVAALPAPPSPAAGGNASGWAKWGRVAMIAGAGAAIAAGGAAAYLHRDTIGAGWGWISSHLEFVGCLARAEELRRRVAYVVGAGEELGVGFANLYTRLGKGATTASAKNQSGGGGTSVAGAIVGSNRTFCNLPTRMKAGAWIEAVNDKAADETSAHMSMFEPKDNPNYKKLATDAAELITQWTKNKWYETSTEEDPLLVQI